MGPWRAERLPGGVEDAEPAVDLLAGEEVPDGEVGAADERGADGLGGQSRRRRQRQGTTEPAARKRAAARMKLELDGLRGNFVYTEKFGGYIPCGWVKEGKEVC